MNLYPKNSLANIPRRSTQATKSTPCQCDQGDADNWHDLVESVHRLLMEQARRYDFFDTNQPMAISDADYRIRDALSVAMSIAFESIPRRGE